MDDSQNPYAETYRSPQGPGDSRPTALQIVKDNSLVDALPDHVILITGCSSGLGVETARALAATGATLYLTARNLSKARETLGPDLVSNPKIHLLELNLDSLDSVRACVKTFLSKSSHLNVIITNAGIRHVPYAKTQDGFERHFAVNHLSHFLLINLLLPTLRASSSAKFPSRVVAVSSTAHRNSDIDFDDLNLSKPGAYSPAKGYTQSKLANVYMASEITRRYGSSREGRVFGLAVHPGGIRTGLQNQPAPYKLFMLIPIPELFTSWYFISNLPRIPKLMRSAEQGAATSVLAAVGKRFHGRGALYLEDCGEAVPVKKGWGQLDPGYVPGRTDNAGDAKRCWAVSCGMVGVQDDGL